MARPDILTDAGYREVVALLNEQSVLNGSRCTRRVWLDRHEPKKSASVWRIGRALQHAHLLSAYAGFCGEMETVERAQPWSARVAETTLQLQQGALELIGACFEVDGVCATVDHIRLTDSGWVITSIRGAASPKSAHNGPLAQAMWVMRQCGYSVAEAQVATINPDWAVNTADSPFRLKRVTQSAETRAAQLDELIPKLRSVVASNDPEPTPGSHCHKPSPCPHLATCQPAAGDRGLSELYRVKAKVIRQLDAQGVTHIGDIPEATPLPPIASRQRRAHMSGSVAVSNNLPAALSRITRPTVYIDFEAIQPALPDWPDARPFGVLPVQVSLHTLDEDDHLTHAEWLAQPGQDPRPHLATFLANHLNNDATLVAYHSTFELNVLNKLEDFCSRADAQVLADAQTRIVDMLPMVRDNVYHPDFKGKFSLKSVVEALLPDLSYRGLTIRRGDEASLVLEAHCRGQAAAFGWSDHERTRALLDYCGRDTLVMVHLESILRELASTSD